MFIVSHKRDKNIYKVIKDTENSILGTLKNERKKERKERKESSKKKGKNNILTLLRN